MKILITGASGFIGINLIDYFLSKGFKNIINVDKVAPIKKSHIQYWTECNIMDEALLKKVFDSHHPDIVIHLAARTDTLSDKLEDYVENHVGTQHLLNVINKSLSVKRAIITSTQYVYKSGDQPFPSADDDFKPHTIYGESKVLTEKFARNANLSCEWVIVRPTNIWGPWHMRYPNELWRMLDKKMYYHPVSHPVIRTYGYVKNIVHQIYGIAMAPAEQVNHQVFYVGDASVDSFEWLNEISKQLTRTKIKKLPTFIFKTIALAGDMLNKMKVPFPLYSKRFNNMVEDYPAPTEKTIKMFGQADADLENNVKETILWLKGEGSVFLSTGKSILRYYNLEIVCVMNKSQYKSLKVLNYDIFTDELRNLDFRQRLIINTINQYSYCIAEEDPLFKAALKNSTVLLPDGIGIVKAAKILNKQYIKKIAGADLHFALLEHLNTTGGKCFYLGASESTLTKIKVRIAKEYPSVRVDSYSPPFKKVFTADDDKKMCQMVNDSNADVLFVGMTAPKQEKWVYANQSNINVDCICTVGAVFDFFAGTINRPYQFWIDMGLEWFVRLTNEPKRMSRRYLYYGPVFAKYLYIFKKKYHKI